MKFIKFITLAVILSGLLSCVMETTKTSTVDVVLKPELIEIDSDIEDDFNSAVSYLKSSEYDEAIVLLLEIIAVENRVPAPYVNLAMAYNKKDDLRNAEKYFLLALSLDLTHRVANNQLGLLYRKKGKFEDAKKAYSNALTKYPDYLPVVKNLGILCELYLRNLSCALKQYEHYLDLQPDDKIMKIWVADLSRRLK